MPGNGLEDEEMRLAQGPIVAPAVRHAAYSRADTEQRLLFLGVAMGITMLTTSGWLVLAAPRLAEHFASRQVPT